jgi:hypothetical protein
MRREKNNKNDKSKPRKEKKRREKKRKEKNKFQKQRPLYDQITTALVTTRNIAISS